MKFVGKWNDYTSDIYIRAPKENLTVLSSENPSFKSWVCVYNQLRQFNFLYMCLGLTTCD